MSLWFNVMINADHIGTVTIQRISTAPDGHHSYRWNISQEVGKPDYSGELEHIEGDGPLGLISKVLLAHRDAPRCWSQP